MERLSAGLLDSARLCASLAVHPTDRPSVRFAPLNERRVAPLNSTHAKIICSDLWNKMIRWGILMEYGTSLYGSIGFCASLGVSGCLYGRSWTCLWALLGVSLDVFEWL